MDTDGLSDMSLYFQLLSYNYSFYSPRSRNSHFHYINPAKYHTFHIYTIYKLFKNSRKQHISYLLKNHCFWHFSPFWHFSRSAKITQFQENLKNTIFYYFPIRWRQYDFPHFYLIPQNTQKCQNSQNEENRENGENGKNGENGEICQNAQNTLKWQNTQKWGF